MQTWHGGENERRLKMEITVLVSLCSVIAEGKGRKEPPLRACRKPGAGTFAWGEGEGKRDERGWCGNTRHRKL